jgi:hypothetical protein
MDALRIALLGVGVAIAALLLVGLRMKWIGLDRWFEEDQGWHRMWHERILDTTDERDGRDPGPP